MHLEIANNKVITKMVVLVEIDGIVYEVIEKDETKVMALKMLAYDGLELVKTKLEIGD